MSKIFFSKCAFVKDEYFIMWILWKMSFSNCELCEKWYFENANFVKNIPFASLFSHFHHFGNIWIEAGTNDSSHQGFVFTVPVGSRFFGIGRPNEVHFVQMLSKLFLVPLQHFQCGFRQKIVIAKVGRSTLFQAFFPFSDDTESFLTK